MNNLLCKIVKVNDGRDNNGLHSVYSVFFYFVTYALHTESSAWSNAYAVLVTVLPIAVIPTKSVHWTASVTNPLAATVMLIVAVLLLSVPSLARNVKLSLPVNPLLGVYVKFGAVPLKDPLLGLLNTENVKLSPSASVADKKYVSLWLLFYITVYRYIVHSRYEMMAVGNMLKKYAYF